MALLLHQLPPALVTLAGDQAASAALVTCVALAPCATEGMGAWASRPLGLPQVPWEVAAVPCSWREVGGEPCGGQRGCFCHAWKGPDGGEETQRFRQRGLQWWSASSTQLTAFIPVPARIRGGPSLSPSAKGTVPDTRPLEKQEHRAHL